VYGFGAGLQELGKGYEAQHEQGGGRGLQNRLLSTFDQDCDTADLDEPTQKALQALLKACLEEVNHYVKTELDPAWEALDKIKRQVADF
jgi:hypothetical protein